MGTMTTGATRAMRADVLFIVSTIAFTNCAKKMGLVNRVGALVGATCEAQSLASDGMISLVVTLKPV